MTPNSFIHSVMDSFTQRIAQVKNVVVRENSSLFLTGIKSLADLKCILNSITSQHFHLVTLVQVILMPPADK